MRCSSATATRNFRYVRRIEVCLFCKVAIDRIDKLFIVSGRATEYKIEIVGRGNCVKTLTLRQCTTSPGIDLGLIGMGGVIRDDFSASVANC